MAQQQLPSDPVTNLIYVKELMFNPFAYAWRSWLPLYAGEATLYTDACPAMPWFLAGALVAAAFALLHTFSMVVAFDGFNRGRRRQAAAVPAAHLVAALLVRPFWLFLAPSVSMQQAAGGLAC